MVRPREDQANAAADALPRQPLRNNFGASRFRASLSRIRASPSELDSHSFEPCALEPHVSKPRFHVSEPHSFKPHPVGSLHFFDPDPAPPDPRLQNTCPVSVMSMRRVSKRAGQRTYKASVGGVRLRLQGFQEKDN